MAINITNTMIFEKLLQLTKEIEGLKKLIKPIKKQKRYSYKEAAELLCITVAGLKTRIQRGKLKRIENDGKPMIAAEDIERFLLEQNPDLNNSDL